MIIEKKVKIILHGSLKKLYDKPIELVASCVAEAINGMCKMTKAFDTGLNKDMIALSVKGCKSKDDLYKNFKEDEPEIHLVPAMFGAGGGGAGTIQIIVAVVLIIIAIALQFVPGGQVAGVAVGKIGFSLAIAAVVLAVTGVVTMLMPQPKKDKGTSLTDVEASRYLGAAGNTTKIGTRIPIIYGKMKAYGHYLSFDVDAKDIAVA